MKIAKVQIPRIVKSLAITAPLLLTTPALKAQENNTQDCFIKSNTTCITETPDSMLESKSLKVGDDYVYPAVVIDLSEGKLYHYDLECYLVDSYKVATGKKSTPTKTGLRRITHIEDYPYKSAPRTTKRYKNPDDYGPHVICLETIDIKTGKSIGTDGQFIHGTNQPNSIGKKASKGCVRLNNEDIEKLIENVYKEQYVLIRE